MTSSGVRIGCSVITGLERVARDEIKEKLEVTEAEIDSQRGKVFFELCHLGSIGQVTKLRSVEHVFAVVDCRSSEEVFGSTEEAEKYFMTLPDSIDWTDGLKAWAAYYSSSGYSLDCLKQRCALPEDYTPQFSNGRKRKIPGIPAFRVTASRSGERNVDSETENKADSDEVVVKQRHSFTSDQAAKWFGAAINNKFGWQPNMKNFDMEVAIFVHESRIIVGLLLTSEALHKRNISVFGHTTLNSTIAYALGRMCDLRVGDVMMDPLCGTGAIPIECCAYTHNSTYCIGSELSHNPADKAMTNQLKCPSLFGLNSALSMDVARFDATLLPVKTASVDVVITDLPFGLRVGSKKNNQALYPQVLSECARIVRPKSGRGAFLTQDKRNFLRALERCKSYWFVKSNPHINMGGMTAAIFVLSRTHHMFEPPVVSKLVQGCRSGAPSDGQLKCSEFGFEAKGEVGSGGSTTPVSGSPNVGTEFSRGSQSEPCD